MVKGAVQRRDSVWNLKPPVVSVAIKAKYLQKSTKHFFPKHLNKQKYKEDNDHKQTLNLLFNCEIDFFFFK